MEHTCINKLTQCHYFPPCKQCMKHKPLRIILESLWKMTVIAFLSFLKDWLQDGKIQASLNVSFKDCRQHLSLTFLTFSQLLRLQSWVPDYKWPYFPHKKLVLVVFNTPQCYISLFFYLQLNAFIWNMQQVAFIPLSALVQVQWLKQSCATEIYACYDTLCVDSVPCSTETSWWREESANMWFWSAASGG